MSRSRLAVILALVVVAAVVVAGVEVFKGGSPEAGATHPKCPARTGSGAYDVTVRPASGAAGSMVTVSGSLPVMREDGTYGGQSATQVEAYWNLNFRRWWSVLGNSPSPSRSVARSAVVLLGRQDVAKLCRYEVQVRIPRVARGKYPIEVLYEAPGHEAPSGGGKSFASFSPTDFRVAG